MHFLVCRPEKIIIGPCESAQWLHDLDELREKLSETVDETIEAGHFKGCSCFLRIDFETFVCEHMTHEGYFVDSEPQVLLV